MLSRKRRYFVLFWNIDLVLIDKISHTNSKKSDNNIAQPMGKTLALKDPGSPLHASIQGSKHFILSPGNA